MVAVTVRSLPDAVHLALRVRAAANRRSTEAEIRNILELAVLPPQRLRLGTALAELGRRSGLTDADLDALEPLKNKQPASPMAFGR